MRYTKISDKELNKLFKQGAYGFGGSSFGGISLDGKAPEAQPANALYLLNKKYGAPLSQTDGYKVSFEYIFKSPNIGGLYHTVYDYKGWLSAGFLLTKTLNKKLHNGEDSQKLAKQVQADHELCMAEVFEKVEHYDGYITLNGYDQ